MNMQEIKDEEMVQTMIAQHGGLRAEIKDMHERSENISANGEVLYADMQLLGKTLKAHLALENDVFYPRLLERMERKGFDTKNTREFIRQMKGLGDQVFAFLEEYGSADAIVRDQERYTDALESISSALLMRMSAEEDGVYMYWNI